MKCVIVVQTKGLNHYSHTQTAIEISELGG